MFPTSLLKYPTQLNNDSVDKNDNYIDVDNEKCGIRDVWASNLQEEFQSICR